MSLQETLEETKKQLAAALDNEQETKEEVNDEVTEDSETGATDAESAEEAVKESDKEEAKKEEVKAEKKEDAKEPTDDAGWARLRREKAAAEKRAQEAEEKLQKKAEPNEEKENPLDNELLDLIKRNRVEKAEKEFISLEGTFAAATPDYHDVSNGYKEALYHSLRIQNPRKGHGELLDMTKNALLHKAGEYASKGLDPILEMYEEARSLGFKKVEKQVKEEVETKEEKKRPDLDNVARNKARNAGMAAAQGAKQGGGQITAEAASTMTTQEWSKIPQAERMRIIKSIN